MDDTQELTQLKINLTAYLDQQFTEIRRSLLASVDVAVEQYDSGNINEYESSLIQNSTTANATVTGISSDIANDLIRSGTVNLERLGNKILRQAGHSIGDYAVSQVFDGTSNYEMRFSTAQSQSLFTSLLGA